MIVFKNNKEVNTDVDSWEKSTKKVEIIIAQRVTNNFSFTTLQRLVGCDFYKGQGSNYTPKKIAYKLLTFQKIHKKKIYIYIYVRATFI